MNKRPIESARDADLRFSRPAMQRAARRARELAQKTGTAIVISHDGVVETLHPDESEPASGAQQIQQAATPYRKQP